MTQIIQNPILPGFHPDPSIVRVGEDYYLATSTFEWFPGVRIFHSRDLANWTLVATPLDRLRQLDLIGVPDSGGVWAPCLSHCDGLFYLVYTNTKLWDGCPYKTCYNYLVTAQRIDGPWSDPVYLNASGFDPSLFHDTDGRKWIVNMEWDHRPGRNAFSGILLQEYSHDAKQLIGPIRKVFTGTDLGCVEGPHIFRRDNWYYLLTAEGGTGYKHACTVARSRTLEGPYEVDPETPFLTSAGAPDLELQKAGHGDFVCTPAGDWYLAHLCSRPVKGTRRCVLGRETALQKIEWSADGWPRIDGGGSQPKVTVAVPGNATARNAAIENRHYTFGPEDLDKDFQSLRQPIGACWISLSERPGWLRLKGADPLSSCFHQSLIGRRVQHFHSEAETLTDYRPVNFQQSAGLTFYYDTRRHYHLMIGCSDSGQRMLNVWYRVGDEWGFLLEEDYLVPDAGSIGLKIRYHHDYLELSYKTEESDWIHLPCRPDATWLSDDAMGMAFTGAFFCLSAQDLSGQYFPADFNYFIYRSLDDRAD